ncbi:HAMP domain-containing sensor histidine kinase [Psychrobacillus antarcticus]|uniref:HAMP domain-containing sensor histidine kinase n=1 Tax=Psychrobacillus antarcticus TaxID=2879115 RepID=UPI00240783DE|nr:HAMP domain-containing sensor histidine kinase [Psychrobacillus antarcticus]
MAEEMVNRITDVSIPGVPPSERVPNFAEDRFRVQHINPTMYILNTDGEVISSNLPLEQENGNAYSQLVNGKEEVETFTSAVNNKKYYAVKKKIEIDDELVGWVMMVESKDKLTTVKQEYSQLAILIVGLAIFGWGAIYFLSRRLALPIKQVAEAAKQVQSGNYEISLSDHIKEKELYELVSSFKQMAGRLEQLEKTRTELLAGVTHELKTPVTSISGLLQAVNDDVVTGQEAEQFIRMALVETTKMKTMVGDLLAFNSFAVDAVPVNISQLDIDNFMKDLIAQWKAVQEQPDIVTKINLLHKKVIISADLVRLQQIMTNLLTNAEQAISGIGEITISLSEKGAYVSVIVKDSGSGIPPEEQAFIFERFFRGEKKKYGIRGLGLGLPLSKMMAQSIKGNLNLIESTEEGTCFELLIRKEG